MALDRDFRPIDVNFCRRVRFLNNSGAALNEGDGFFITGGTITVLADSNTVGLFGVCCADVAADAVGKCWTEGAFLVDTEGTVNFALGGKAYCAGASSVDLGTAGDVPIGVIVKEDPADGAETVTIEIISHAYNNDVRA